MVCCHVSKASGLSRHGSDHDHNLQTTCTRPPEREQAYLPCGQEPCITFMHHQHREALLRTVNDLVVVQLVRRT